MFVRKIRGSSLNRRALSRSLRLGVSATGLMLAGAALSPAMAQTRDLMGGTVNDTTFGPFNVYTNGTFGAIAGAGGLTYAGAMNDSLGAFTLNKTGIGTLTLTGSGLNTYSGQTTVSNGVLAAGAANVFSANSVLRINSASVALNGFSQSVAALSGNGPLNNTGAAAVLTLAGAAATQSQNGAITGDIKIVKNGAYRQNFNGASTFTGGIDVNGGTISYGTDTAFGTGTITFNTDASLTPLNFGRTIANNIVLGGVVTYDTFASVLSGQISGTGSFTKLGNNALTLTNSGNNFSGGLLFAAGTVNFANGSLGTGTITTLAQQVTMSSMDPSATINNNFNIGATVNFELPNAPGTLELAGNISGAGGLFLKTGTGALVVGGNNTQLGNTFVTAGTLGLKSNTGAGAGAIFVQGAAAGLAAYANGLNIASAVNTQIISGVDTRGFDMTLSGVISNVSVVLIGGLNKTGAGTLTLTNTNTYTDATTVSAGRLNVNGSLVSAVTVNNGGTLGGTGTINNTVTVANGGTIAPGTSPGTLTVNNLLLDAGSSLAFELADPAQIGNGVNDLIIVNNNLTLDGTVNVTALAAFDEGTYRIINYAGALTNNGLLIGTTPAEFALVVDTATAGQVNLVATFTGTRFWDGTGPFGNGVVNGGTGTWDSNTKNWTSMTGIPQVKWGNTVGVFAGTAGTVTLAGTQAFTNLDFQTAGYTLTGDNLAINNSTINTSAAGVTTINSIIQGTNGLTKAGVGTLVLNGANTFTGGLAVNAGTVRVGSNNALGAGNATFAAGTTLQGTTGAFPALANNIVLGGAVTFDANGGGTTLDGVISGNGALSISDVGPANINSGFQFNGANTFTGNVSVTNTLLFVGGNTGLGNAANTLTLNNAILGVTGTFTTPRTVTLTGTGTILVQPGLTLTANGAIGGAGQLVKDGAGTLVLGNAANSYGGGTVITNGIVSVASNGALGNAASGVSFSGTTLQPPTSPTTLRFTADVTSDRAIGIATGFTGVIDTVANEVTLSGAITDAGTLGKAGSGRLTLTGVNNTYAGGTNLDAGTLRISNSNAIGPGAVNTTGGTTFTAGLTNDNSVITLANNFVLGVGTTSVQLNGINFSNDIVTGEVITDGTDLTINGVISGDGGLTTTGASGRLFLNGNNSYAGGTTLNRTVAYLGNGNGLGTGQVTLENFGGVLNESGAALTATNAIFVNGTRNIIGGTNDLTVTGAITGAQILNKAGTGTVTLTNINSGFTGTLAINQGILLADGALTNAAVTVAVGQGTTLGGVGNIAGTVNVANFATLAPGQSPGVLTIGTLNLLNNSLLSYEFGAANTIAGPLNDQVVVTGNLLLDGRLSVTQSAGGAFTKGVYNLFTYGALTNNNVIIDNLANGLTGVIQVNANANQVNLLITGPGQLFQYWDGVDVVGNGVINGGTATWNTTDFNWTGTTDNDTVLPTADLNTTWQSGSVAIFRGTAGTVSLDTNFTAAGLEFQADGYTLINGGLTVAGGGLFARTEPGVTATINSPLSGAGLLTKQGTGTLVLGGNNTYVGGTALTAGTIGVTSNTALGTGALTFTDGTTLRSDASVTLANAAVLNGTSNVDTNGNTLRLNGVVSGAGLLAKNGAGNLILAGTNTYGGGTNLNAGSLTIGNSSAIGTGTLTTAGGTTVFAGLTPGGASVITLGNAVVLNGATTLNLQGTTGDITPQGVLTLDGTTLTLNGAVSGAGSLLATGFGRVNLNGNNGYSGGTTLNFAAAYAGTDTAFGTGAITFDNGIIGNDSGALRTLANNVVLTGGGTILGPNDITLNGTISGADELTKRTTSVLTLNGANGYAGGTTFAGGTIVVGTSTALGTGTLFAESVGQSTTLRAGAADLTLANAVFLQPTSNLVVDSQAFTFGLNGVISGTGALIKVGSGNLILSRANNYSGGTALTAGTITVTTATALGSVALTATGGTSLVAGANGLNVANAATLLAGNLTVDSGTGTFQLSGVVGGAGGLTKINSGNLILSAANTYAGGTNLNAGSIQVGNNTALGINGPLNMADGTTLLSGAGTFTLANAVAIIGTGTVDTNGQMLTLGGIVSGDTLTKIGAGTLVLNGANTYSVATNLNAGSIQIGNNTALGINGPLNMATGTTLQSGAGTFTLANAVAITGTGTVDTNGQTLTLGGIVSGDTLTKIGAGTLVLNGANTYTAGTNLNVGTIQVGTSTALGTGALAMANGTTLLSGAAALSLANAVGITGTGTVDTNGNTFTLGGIVSGDTLTKIGAGTLVLNGANTYTAGTNLNVGTIQVGTSTALGTGALAMANGTTLLSGAAALSLANAVGITGTGTVDTNGNTFTLGGVVSGDTLTKIGAGTLVLNGANTYTAGTNLNVGTIQVGTNTALGTGALAMANGTTLLSGAADLTLANAVGITGTGTVDTNGNTLTLGGVVSGATLTKISAGTLVLNGANTYTGGTNLNAGTIQVGTNAALGTGALAMANGTTLQAGANGLTTANAIGVTGTGTIDTQGFGYTVTGQISGGAVTKIGAGTLTLDNANTYAGGTNINAGTVIITTNTSLGGGSVAMADGTTVRAGAANLVVANAFALTGNDTIDTQAFTLTLGGVLSGAGGVTKVGTGTLTLTGASTYTGATAVNEGVLNVRGSLANTAVTVASGASLTGNGTIVGAVTILDGGILSPGNSPGTLTVGPLTLNNGSILNWEFGAANTIGGALNDLVIVNGDLVLDGILNVSQSAGGNFTNGIYEIIQYTGNLTDNILSLGGALPNGNTGFVQAGLVPGQVNLIVTQTPSLILFWDGADGIGNGVISGGSGTWSALSTNWTGAAPSALNTNWQSLIGVFQGTAGTVTIDGPQAFDMLQFAVDGYTLNSGVAGSLTTAGAGVLFASTGANATINAPITGAGSIVKQGGGSITLNASNSYAGGTDLQIGTIIVGNNNALGTGTLAMSGGTTLRSGVNNLTIANAITTAGVGTVDTNGNQFTLSGVISGAGSISKISAGNLTLSGANSFNGLSIAAGSVTASTSNTALGAGTVSMANGTTLFIATNALTIANNFALAAGGETIDVLGNSVTLNGTIAGAGRLTYTDTVLGAGDVITINGTNTYTGGTNVLNTTIAINADAALGDAAGDLALTTATVRTGASFASGRAVSLTDTGTFGVAGGTTLTLNGVISGSGQLVTNDTGTLVLNGNNTYTGGTNHTAGTVVVGSNTALGTNTFTYNGQGTRVVSGVDNLVVANNFVLNNNNTLNNPFDTQAFTTTLSGQISGAGAFAKFGTGTLILTGNNSYAGGTDLIAGTISVGTNTAIGTGNLNFRAGTTLQAFADNVALANTISTNAGTETVDTQAFTFTLNGVISGGGLISKIGTGNLILNGNNSYSGGTNLTAGTITVGTNSALGTGALVMSTNTTLAAGVSGLTIANAISTLGNGIVNQGPGVFTLNGVIDGAGSISAIGSGNLVLNGNNSFTNLGINNGRVTVGTNTAAGIGAIAMANNTTLAAGVSGLVLANNITTAGNGIVDQGTGIFTLNGVIDGAGSISTINTGNLVLNGNNAFTNLGIGAGTVTVGTNTAAGIGAIAMANNTTLAAGVSGLTLANFITTAGNGIVDQGTGIFTLNGNIGGAGSISTVNTGNLVLNGTNTFTNLGIGAGTVTVGTNTAAGIGAVSMANNTTLAAGTSGLVLANNITTAGNGIVDQGTGTFTLNGVIDGAGSISTVNTGNLVLNGNNAFTNLGIGAGTVTVGTNTAAGIGAIAMANNTTLAAGANNLVLANFITTAGTGLVNAGGAGNVFTLNGNIGGAGSITQIDAGTLVLNGTNTFTNLGISNGKVFLGTNTAAGVGGIALANNTTLGAAVSGLVVANNITTAGNGIIDQGTGIFTLNGVIDGAGSISTVNTGNLVLNGNNAFTNLGIGAGTVTVGTNTAAGIGAISLANNTTLAAGVSGLVLANNITTAGNGIVDQGTGTFTLNGLIDGAGSISTVNFGNLILNGNNAFTNLGIGNGTVTVGTNTAAGIGGISMANNTTLAAGVSGLVLANNIVTAGNGIINQGTGIFTLNGQIGGAGSISTVNTGNLVLNGNNAFTNLGIGAGTVTVGTNTAAGIGAISMASNTTLAAGVSGLVLANNITTAGNGIINQGTGTFTLNGVIDGAGSISTINFGNLILNGNNAFTNLGIGNGTVTVGTNTAAGIGGIAMANNTTLAAGVSGLVLANGIVTAGNGIINQGTGVFTLNGQIGGAGSISTVNTGNLVLNGNNAFTNLGIGAGTVTVGTNTAAGIGAISMASNTTLAAGVSGLVLANNITTAGNGIVNQGTGIFTLNGVIDGAGSISTVNTGNLVLNGNNAFTNLGIGAGAVTVGTNTAAGIGAISLANNTTLAAGVSGLVLANNITTAGNGIVDQGTGTFTLNGLIDGAGSISTVNFGNLILNGNNAFTNLGIGNGTVTVGTNTAAGIGAIAMANNTTLAAGVSGLVLANSIQTAGNGIINQGTGTFTLNGQISGPGSISTVNFGNLVLNGTNLFTNLGIGNGTVTVGTNTAAGIGAIAMATNTTLAAGVSGLVLANSIQTAGNGIINQGTGTFTLNGQISGPGSISSVNFGNLVLNGNNLFTNLGIGNGTVTVGTNTAAGIGAIAMATNTTLAAGVSGLVLANSIQTAGNGIINQGTGTFTLNGQISGPGSISSVNFGNLVLNGNNLFTNLGIGNGTVTVGTNTAAGIGAIALATGTTLAAGANNLTLANSIQTAGIGTINTGANTMTLTGIISGAGNITKTGTGILNLTAANIYTGGTVINAGTVGFSTAASFGTGTITVNSGTLLANANNLTLSNLINFAGAGAIDTAANALTVSSVISGSGRITKLGTGTLTLTGANTFTGGTTISAGTLVGSVATLGSGGILNNAALVFNQTVDATFNQVISGTGSITKQGAGALTIASVNTVTGPTTVTAGRLNVTGSLASSAVTLQTGTSLIGTGTVGALTAQSGSTVSPGATAGSVATLTVNGALNLAAGSTLAIDVTPAGADRVTASGAATTAGNLVVTAAGLPFATFNQNYTIVSGSSRTGTFATTNLGAFGQAFAPVLVYDATSVILRLAPNSLVTLGGANISGNALAVANSFDAAVRGGYNPQAFFGLYTQGANLPSALNQLSGELHSAERRAILDDTRVVREAAFDRLNAGLSAIAGSQSVTSENDGKATTFWLRAAGSWGTARADGIGSRFTTEQRGVLTGVDFATNGFKVGGMFYYSNTDVELASLGKSTVESVGGAIYGGYRQEGSGFAVGVGGSIASSNADGSRAITAPGLAQALTSNVDGTSYQVFGEIAFDLVAAENTRIEPFARAAYAKVDSKAFAETGGIAGVTGIGQSSDATLTTLGMRAAFTTGMATLSGSAGWQRTTGDRNAASILVIPGVNTPYSVSTVSLDKDAVALEAEASFSLSQKITLGVGYSGVIGDNNTNHGARATLTVGF